MNRSKPQKRAYLPGTGFDLGRTSFPSHGTDMDSLSLSLRHAIPGALFELPSVLMLRQHEEYGIKINFSIIFSLFSTSILPAGSLDFTSLSLQGVIGFKVDVWQPKVIISEYSTFVFAISYTQGINS